MRAANPLSPRSKAKLLSILLLAGVVLGAAGAAAAAATVDAQSPGTVISPPTPNAVIPITITRPDNTPISGVSVTFQLSNLDYASTSLGAFLGATGGNPSGPFVTNNGGGSYTLDAATLGTPCGSSATSGVLFNVTVGSSATSGTGTLTITQVKLRDCSNAPLAATIGLTASVDVDRTGPTITACAPNQSGAAGAGCQAAVPDFTSSVTATDAHGPITVTQSPTAGTLVGVGATVVTLTVSDHVGNSSTCTASFTVTDLTPPSITAPPDVTVGNATGQCSATGVSLGTPTTSDNCGVASVTNDAPASFPVGTTTVTWTATDAHGNTATATQHVTVNDTERPVITAPANVTVGNTAGLCAATGVSLGTPAFSDNCPGATVSNDAPASFPVGTTTVTWTVTDAAGHTATATQHVTVNDTESPAITGMPSNLTAFTGPGAIGCSATTSWTAPSATDNCPGVTLTSDHAPGSSFPVGATLVTYTATDASSHVTTASFTVTVVDNTSPLVTLSSPNGGETWIIGTSHSVSWSGSDNCSLATFDLELSTNGGSSYAPIVSAQPYAAGFSWTVPNAPTTQARLRVTVHDGAGNSATDAGDADFTIRPSNLPPTLSPIGNKVTDELVLLTFTAVASDPDAGQTLTFSLDSGAPAGTSIDPSSGVFSWTPTEAQGPGVYPVTVRVTDNGAPPLDSFETIQITVNEVDLAPVTLTATPLFTGNDSDGTTKIRLTWTAQPAGTSVRLYRKGFGSYPEYDDLGGTEPAAPTTYPPDTGWDPVAMVSGTSYDDEVAWPARDFWYYVAYVQGPGANVSPASNRTDGTLNYKLGDVMSPALFPTESGHGDNVVNTSDISLLGAHYGLAGDLGAFNYLDVGPTTTGYVNGRPLTDDRIDFEDLILFAINFDVPAAAATTAGARPAARPLAAAAGSDHVSVEAPTSVASGSTFTVRLRMSGSGDVQGLSALLAWDAAVAYPTSAAAGSWLTSQNGIMFSPQPGMIDAAILGVHDAGLTGDGVVAELTFVAQASGDPRVRLVDLKARDAINHPVLAEPLGVGPPGPIGSTMLGAPNPNPFHATAQFAVSLPEAGPMEFAVFSVDGRRVRILATGERPAGEYRLVWDGRSDSGQSLKSGVYYARLETRKGRWVRTVALLR